MRRAVIIGNSGAARECYWLLQDMLKADSDLQKNLGFKCFLSWQGYPSNLEELAHLFAGDAAGYAPESEDFFILGMGDPALRAQVYTEFKNRGGEFINLVHPTADICPSACIGEGNILHRGSTVYCNASVGNGNYLNGYVNVAHDAQVGDFNFIAPGSLVLGRAQVGSFNRIGPHCCVLDGAKVGDYNLIAPGSFIYKGCGSRARMAGNPALKIDDIAEM